MIYEPIHFHFTVTWLDLAPAGYRWTPKVKMPFPNMASKASESLFKRLQEKVQASH